VHTVERNGPSDHGTFLVKKAKTANESKQSYFQKKLTQRRKTHLPTKKNKDGNTESGKGTNLNMVRTQREDFIDSWPQTLRSDRFDMAEFEDTNISEEAQMDMPISMSEDVRANNANGPQMKKYSQNANTNKKRSRTGRKLPTRKQPVSLSMVPPPIPEAESNLGLHKPHPPDPEQVIINLSDGQTVNIIFSYMVGGFIATTVAYLSALLVESICNCAKACGRKSTHHEWLNDTEQEKIEVNSELNLAALPTNLEEFLVKKMDVRYKGQHFYCWQKVGTEFKISRLDLRYLKIEYKRDNGSPTSKLLEMLGKAKGKTISDLMDVLKSPKVNRPDITTFIKLT